jgi:hypothetical protein
MEHISDALRERNIELATSDRVARGGFTQVPNFILRDGTLSLGTPTGSTGEARERKARWKATPTRATL